MSIIFTVSGYSVAYGQAPEKRQRDYDPSEVAVTRWLDSTTRPMTYDEYVQSRDFAERQVINLVFSPLAQTDEIINIIVNEDLYPEIEGALDTFMLDLQTEGYGINLYTANEVLSPMTIRDLLYQDWLDWEISGVIFVGDLAVPWYEMYEPEDWGGNHVEFPCDLFFMDLDGAWIDADSDGKFDEHFGSLGADIWVGRLVSSPMNYHGADEVSLLRNYFRKNHLYRIGELRMDDHGLAFIDNDWNMYGWGYDVALAFADTDSLVDIYETCRDNYIEYVRGDSDNRYEHVLICSHSSAFAHYIYYNDYNYELFHNNEIESFIMQSLTYNLFACSNSRYVESDNMGGWYIFETEYGLLSVGCTKTGSMLCFEDFYYPLGQGATYGGAMLEWSQINMEHCAGEASRAWFYGMCIQGDPTIKLARFQDPIGLCDYVPGDFNGSGEMNIADIVDSYARLKTGLPDPSLLCECPYGSGNSWAVAMDVNNSCDFNIVDVVLGYSKLKTGSPDLLPCDQCPPAD
jgi:hypothetical protein